MQSWKEYALPFYILLCIFCAPTLGWAADSSVRHLRAAVSTTPLSSPFYVAQAMGFFTAEGLDVQILPAKGGHRAMASLLDGQVQMATASDMVIMNASRNGAEFTVPATFVTSTNDLQLIGHRDSEVLSVQDLYGKKIAVTKGSASQYFVDTHLLLSGIQVSDVEYIHHQPEEMSQVLYAREVDAVSTWQPWARGSLAKLGPNGVILGDVNVYTLTFNLIVQADVSADPILLSKVLKALIKAEEYIDQHPEEAQAIVAKQLGMSMQSLKSIWGDYDFQVRLDQSLVITLESELEWKNSQEKPLRPMLDFLDYIQPEPLQAINADRVTVVR